MNRQQLTTGHVMRSDKGDSTSGANSEGCPTGAQPGGVATGSLRHADTHHAQGQVLQSDHRAPDETPNVRTLMLVLVLWPKSSNECSTRRRRRERCIISPCTLWGLQHD